MRLSQASDFAMRILMLLERQESPMTVEMISSELRLVHSHVMKIVAKLVKAGFLNSTRGRSGGVSLGQDAEAISVGDIVKAMEPDFAIVECMRDAKSECVFADACKLRGVFNNAKQSFLKELDQHTLASLVN